MALVGYSDSEESEMEDVTPSTSAKPSTNKRVNRSGGGKIKIELPAIQAETVSIEPASKRQRTAGAFSGFNSLLPAPKKNAQTSIKPGFKLKTSSEAAFSRGPPSAPSMDLDDQYVGDDRGNADPQDEETTAVEEPKLVGKATRFLPLSVANANKKKKKPAAAIKSAQPANPVEVVDQKTRHNDKDMSENEPKLDRPKPKQSLFSMEMDTDGPLEDSTGDYKPEFTQYQGNDATIPATANISHVGSTQQPALQGVASDLDLSDADRRRLFGRLAKAGDVKISHFNMDTEYRANQDIAANGELVEHRAVKAIAPGKHSLQQLVNNVRGQSDAIEDKWAEGRRNRGEASSKYGWS